MLARRCALACAGLIACGDRAPPALWPEAPPPTLAKPIGMDAAVRPATRDGAAATAGTEDAKAEPARTSADEPYPPGGTPAPTSDSGPRERPPMPLLIP